VEIETKWQDVATEFVVSENFGLNNWPPIEPVDDIRAKNLLTETTIRLGKHFAIGSSWRLHGIERKINGTNFVGTNKELKDHESLLDCDTIANEAAQKGIMWIFNCPLQPNAGGCWDRLIRIIKGLLKKTLRDIYPRVQTLQSVLIEAENILNARPLTEIPLTHEAEEPLTPNHFLMGCTNST